MVGHRRNELSPTAERIFFLDGAPGPGFGSGILSLNPPGCYSTFDPTSFPHPTQPFQGVNIFDF